MKVFYRITSFCLRLFFKLFYGHKVYGNSWIPSGAAILAANHTSFLDPPIIAASLDEECYFLARSSLFKNRFFKKIIESLNAYPVSGTAQDLNSFKTISKLLKENKKVVIFPEGIRSNDGTIGEIKTGVAMLALKANCPIIPIYIHGAYEIWPRQKKMLRLYGKTACVIGQPLSMPNDPALSKKQQQELFTHRLKDSLLHLQSWYLSGAYGDPP